LVKNGFLAKKRIFRQRSKFSSKKTRIFRQKSKLFRVFFCQTPVGAWINNWQIVLTKWLYLFLTPSVPLIQWFGPPAELRGPQRLTDDCKNSLLFYLTDAEIYYFLYMLLKIFMWVKNFCFVSKNLFFIKNLDFFLIFLIFCHKFRFFVKIFDFLSKFLIFCQKFWFFVKNFDFFLKFLIFCQKVLIFVKNFDFLS